MHYIDALKWHALRYISLKIKRVFLGELARCKYAVGLGFDDS